MMAKFRINVTQTGKNPIHVSRRQHLLTAGEVLDLYSIGKSRSLIQLQRKVVGN